LRENEALLVDSNPKAPYRVQQRKFLNVETGRRRAPNGNWGDYTFNNGRKAHPTAENSILLPDFHKYDFEEKKQEADMNVDIPESQVDENDRIDFTLDETIAAENYWHPLRFDGSEPDVEGLDYAEAKEVTSEMLRNLSSTSLIRRPEDQRGRDTQVAPTKEYLKSAVDEILIRTRDGFEQLYANSMMYDEVCQMDGAYAVGGTIDNPRVVELNQDTEESLQRVWNDSGEDLGDLSSLLE